MSGYQNYHLHTLSMVEFCFVSALSLLQCCVFYLLFWDLLTRISLHLSGANLGYQIVLVSMGTGTFASSCSQGKARLLLCVFPQWVLSGFGSKFMPPATFRAWSVYQVVLALVDSRWWGAHLPLATPRAMLDHHVVLVLVGVNGQSGHVCIQLLPVQGRDTTCAGLNWP